jgi:hypothetical protein
LVLNLLHLCAFLMCMATLLFAYENAQPQGRWKIEKLSKNI